MKKIPFLLLVAVIIVMVAATFVEKATGSAAHIYGSWWFALLWGLLATTGLLYCWQRKLVRRPAVLLLHLSFAIILLGALVTHIWGVTGQVHLRLDAPQPSRAFIDSESHDYTALPFSMQLCSFDIECYPGTDSPMDYVSQVICSTGDTLRISMNHIGQVQHYRFYQASYDPDAQGTVLAVSHDPAGIGITYLGYALLFLSMLLLLVLPGEGFRRALRRLSAVALLLSLPWGLHAAPQAPTADEAHAFCSLYAYYNGRICPVQTIARDFTTKLYGRSSYQGLSAEQVFTGWIFYPTSWLDEPMIKLKGETAQIVGAQGKYASYSQFFDNEQYRLEAHLHQGERSVLEAHEKANLLQMLFSRQLLKLYPYRVGEGGTTWLSQGDNLPMDMPEEEWFFVKKSLDYVGELVVMHQHDRLIETIGKIRKYQLQNAADALPTDQHFRAEMLYNVADYTRPMAMGFATLGIVLFLLFVLRMGRQQGSIPRWWVWSCNAVLALALVYLVFLFLLRWYVSAHLPLSNGFETMQFLALCLLGLTLLLQRRFLLVLPFGFLLCGLTLMVSTFGQGNPQITPLMPVLQSPLLSLHVCVIMVSYALLAFACLCGIAALVAPRMADSLADVSRMLLYPALFCMAAGIFIGAIWANVSWGRYWGWDPKEVWALVTMLVYCLPLHAQSLPLFRNTRAYHIYIICAFLSVLMTYFGVNFLLGGMHSYANS